MRSPKGSLLGFTALTLAAAVSLHAESKIPAECGTGGFFIGCQAYTFNHFTLFEAIEKTALAGGKVIEFYPGQKLSKEEPNVSWDHNASAETIQKVKDKLAKEHVTAVNYGVVDIPQDEAQARKVFEFAKTMGLRAVTTESVGALDTIEKMVKEYDILVGFHDHPKQPGNPNYRMWDPNYVLSVVKDRDARIGSCADTGHWVRSNLKPVDCLRMLKGRIISSHLKDLNAMSPDAHDVPFGTGVSDIPAILDELKSQGFSGNISIEYEHHWENSSPEVGQCIGFVRGYGARGSQAKTVYPRVMGGSNEARVTATLTQIASFKTALDAFEVDNGYYPKGRDGLQALVVQPSDATKWHGPYLNNIPKDPWDGDYVYECPGKHNPASYDICSMGPPGEQRPIGNWTTQK